MAQLPTNRDPSVSDGVHAADHNEVHRLHNLLDDASLSKGDIYVYNGSTLTQLAVGTNDFILTADSAQAAGMKWAALSVDHADLGSVGSDQHHTEDHQSRHQSGGADELTGDLDAVARTDVRKNSTGSVYGRRRLNFIEGSNMTITIADDSGNEEVDITLAAAGGGGGTDHATLTNVTSDQHHTEDHDTRHETGGADAITGNLDANSRVGVRKNTGGSTYLRRRINFIEGANTTITVSDDAGSEEVDVTIATTGGGGGGGLDLTTKGQLHTYDTADAPLAVGANGEALFADSGEATGLNWRDIVEADISDLDHTDITAIHDDVPSEISAITEKASPVAGDWGLLEDSAAANAKKRFQLGNLPYSAPGHSHTESDVSDLDHDDADAIHDNVAAEISTITEKATPVAGDLFIIEDSVAANAKKRLQMGNIVITESQISDLDHTDTAAFHDTTTQEIQGLTNKATPVATDVLLIEDSAGAAWNKKYIEIGDLPSAGSPLTTDGDLFYFNTGDSRLPVGSNGQYLQVSAGLPSWAAGPSVTNIQTAYVIAANDADTLWKNNASETVDGVDDHVQINTALSNYEKVVLSPGTFDIGAEIDMQSYTWLQGSGRGATILKDGGSTTAIIANTTNIEFFEISDLSIDGNYGGLHGIHIHNTNHPVAGEPDGGNDHWFSIHDLFIDACRDGTLDAHRSIYLDGDGSYLRSGILFNIGIREAGIGVELDGSSDNTLNAIHVNARDAGYIIGAANNRLIDCKGFFIDGGHTFDIQSSRNTLTACEAQDFDGAANNGFHVTNDNVSLVNCYAGNDNGTGGNQANGGSGLHLAGSHCEVVGFRTSRTNDANNSIDEGINFASGTDNLVTGSLMANGGFDTDHVSGTPGARSYVYLTRDGEDPYIFGTGTGETFSVGETGNLSTKTGTIKLEMKRAGTIVNTRAAVGTAPTTQAIIIDVNKNTTTVFTSTKLEIAAAATSGSQSGTTAARVFAAGDDITIDIDQVGSGTTGADLSVFVDVEYYD